MNKSMELNDTMWQHVLYHFKMWKDAGYRIGEREAFLNAVAIIYWHLTIRHGEDFIISSPKELADALAGRGIVVETLRDGETYSFTLDGVSFLLQANEYFGGEATLSGAGWPVNRCICNMIHMKPEDYAEFVTEFVKLFPEVGRKAEELARQANREALETVGKDLPERDPDRDEPDPLLDSWVIEENFRWGPGNERLLVGIAPRPLRIT